MDSVHLLMDYQNVHLSVLEAFAPPGTPPHTTLIHPGLYGDALMAKRAAAGRLGTLSEIHVYRGQPIPTREPASAARNQAQAAQWTRDRRVQMHTRPLRYPRSWPDQKAREKGIDVKLACDLVRCALEAGADTLILASRDTDLVPALEMARDVGKVSIEVATWQGCSRLRFPTGPLWCTFLDGADYIRAKDPKQY